MSEAPTGPLRTVLHPTDLTTASELAFVHALRIALAARAKLYVLHVGERAQGGTAWSAFPATRKTLTAWGMLTPGSPPQEVKRTTGVQLVKAQVTDRNAVKGILDFFAGHPSDLIVLATHGRDGLPRYLEGSVAEPVARGTAVPTLFIPHGARSFVDRESGELHLRRVLLPVDHRPRPEAAIAMVGQLIHLLGQSVAIDLLHVGATGEAPAVRVPESLSASVTRTTRAGQPVEQILGAAQGDVDLIAMATSGRQGFMDAIRGSTTERVLRGAPCPVLAVPAG